LDSFTKSEANELGGGFHQEGDTKALASLRDEALEAATVTNRSKSSEAIFAGATGIACVAVASGTHTFLPPNDRS
jgi:hypothetical protein